MIHGPPKGTRSLALIMEDLDVPEQQAVHWLLWNINPEIAEVREHSAPHGAAEGPNFMKKTGYLGPCPAAGTHRYVFRLYALDIKLQLPAQAGRGELEQAMAQHILGTAELAGTYQRTNVAPV